MDPNEEAPTERWNPRADALSPISQDPTVVMGEPFPVQGEGLPPQAPAPSGGPSPGERGNRPVPRTLLVGLALVGVVGLVAVAFLAGRTSQDSSTQAALVSTSSTEPAQQPTAAASSTSASPTTTTPTTQATTTTPISTAPAPVPAPAETPVPDLNRVSGSIYSWDDPSSVQLAGTNYPVSLNHELGCDWMYTEYDLGAGYAEFRSMVGLNENLSESGSTFRYRVLLDGRTVTEGTVSLAEGPKEVAIPILGSQRLRLEALNTTCTDEYLTVETWAAWGSPVVTT